MRCLIIVASVCLAMTTIAFGDDSEAKPATEAPVGKTSYWMMQKLDYSQSILRGLAEGDFDRIERSGSQMLLLNRVEGFIRNRNPSYRAQLHMFERAAQQIVSQARRENLEGVTLAFNQLTVNCVRCHQTLREGPQPSKEPKASKTVQPKDRIQ